MKKITEDYCDFETAKLLKAKRFNEKCLRTYFGDGKMSRIFDDYEEIYNENLLPSVVAAPTLQMAAKWLREVHKIYIDIDASVVYVNEDGEIKFDRPNYAWDIICLENGETLAYSELATSYDSYEQALEAAIKYVLENLI